MARNDHAYMLAVGAREASLLVFQTRRTPMAPAWLTHPSTGKDLCIAWACCGRPLSFERVVDNASGPNISAKQLRLLFTPFCPKGESKLWCLCPCRYDIMYSTARKKTDGKERWHAQTSYRKWEGSGGKHFLCQGLQDNLLCLEHAFKVKRFCNKLPGNPQFWQQQLQRMGLVCS